MITKKIFFMLLVATVVCFSFQDCRRNHPDEGGLFRIVDHLHEVDFAETPLASFLNGSKGPSESEAASKDEKLQQFIADRINKDYVLGNSIHPFSLKVTKSAEPGARPSLRTENVILAPPATTFAVTKYITPVAVLSFGYGIVNDTWDDVHGGIIFEIDVEDSSDRSRHDLFTTILRPEEKKKDRTWFTDQVDLKNYAGREVKLIFKTSHVKGWKLKSILSAWINPTIMEGKDQKKLNVILISIDTLRADHVGSYGYFRSTTLNIDELAKDGVMFRNNIAQAPYTMSSHMSLLTSLYPSFHNVNRLSESYLDSKVMTLAEILYNQGYRTWGITGGGQLSANYGFAEGFETFVEYNNGKELESKLTETFDFLQKEKNNNFFIFFHSFRPHAPYRPPPPYDTMFDPDYKGEINGSFQQIDDINDGKLSVTQRDVEHLMALYDGEIKQTDDALGKLFETLKKEKLDTQTLIVFTSDHGEEFGEHGKVALHSHTLYDELLRVPLILRLPVVLPHGKVIEDQVQSIDILPTILELLNLPQSARGLQGTSLVPLIRSAQKQPPRYAFSERLAADDYYLRSIRKPDYKFIHEEYRKDGTEKSYCFNLKEDPQEQRNLSLPREETENMLNRILFLIKEERGSKKVVRRQELDDETLETLKSLGYIN